MENETQIDFFYIFYVVVFIFYIISFICVIIHLLRFFLSEGSQRWTTKFLTFYCFILFLIYLNFTHGIVGQRVVNIAWSYNKTIDYVLNFMTNCLKLIMAIDIFWCFRGVALYLKHPSLSHTKKFLVYCLSGTLIPLFYYISIELLFSEDEAPRIFIWTEYVLHLIRLIPICGAFWYIKFSSGKRSHLWKNLQLQIRLLILIGGSTSTIDLFSVLIAIMYRTTGESIFPTNALQTFVLHFKYSSIFIEGTIIAIAFTFRKSSFQPISTANAPISEMENVKLSA